MTLVDSFDTEPALLRQRCDVALDGVVNSHAVISIPELRYKSFTLNLTNDAVRKITLEVTAYHRFVFSVVNSHNQKETILLAFFRADSQPARNCQRIIVYVSIASGGHRHNRELNVRALFQSLIDCFQSRTRFRIDDLRVVNDWGKWLWKWYRRDV